MAKTEESALEHKIDNYMKSKRVWQIARFQAMASQNGIPDRLYLYKGFFLGLELKTYTGSPTDLQKKKLKEINNNGGIGIIVTDVWQVEDLIDYIDNYDKSKIDELIHECNDKYIK